MTPATRQPAPPLATAPAAEAQTIECGRVAAEHCARIVEMVADVSLSGHAEAEDRVVMDDACPPGRQCEEAFRSIVVVVPTRWQSHAGLDRTFAVFGGIAPDRIERWAEETVPDHLVALVQRRPMDLAAEMRPELMIATPNGVGPGRTLELTFPRETGRAIAFSLERRYGGDWHYLYDLGLGMAQREPDWQEAGAPDNWETDMVGWGGPGPDVVIIPESAAPGAYRICTTFARPSICTPVEILATDEPAFTGSECPEVARQFGRHLGARILAALDASPTADGTLPKQADEIVIQVVGAADRHLRDGGLTGACDYGEFISVAEPQLLPELPARIGEYMAPDRLPDYGVWLANVSAKLSVIEIADPARRAEPPAPIPSPGEFGDGPWGPLAVLDAPSDSGDLAGLSGNLRIGADCVTLGSLNQPTAVFWRNSQTRWDPDAGTITFLDTITNTAFELHDGDYVAVGGGSYDGTIAPSEPPWLEPPDPSCPIDDTFHVHGLGEVNGFELFDLRD